ncbi:MAG: GNAT family N-acetyltransferase [Candidatus Kryptoniota bacterium]
MDDFGSLTLRNSRILLRSVHLENASELYGIIEESREHLEKWLPWVEYVRSGEDERHIVEQWVYEMQMRSAIHLSITFEDKIAGLVSTHQIDWMNQRTSIGYWVRLEMTGKNLATTATAILMNYLFEKLRLHRIYIQAATDNGPSNKVIRKLGFKLEGVLRENEKVQERYLDHNIYGMTDHDFKDSKRSLVQYL